MPSFLIRFEEAVKTLNSTHGLGSEVQGLVETWKVCKTVAKHLEQGDRLENIAKRLRYLQSCQKQSIKGGESLAKLESKRRQLSTNVLFHQETKSVTDLSTGALNIVRKGSKINHRPSEASSIATLRKLDHSDSDHLKLIRMKPFFKEFEPVSILCSSRMNSRPVFQVPLLQVETQSPRPKPSIQLEEAVLYSSTQHEDKTYEFNESNHDQDPNEIFILPTPPPFVQFPLSSVPEENDSDLEERVDSPTHSNPILFVNPFASTSADESEQLPSPPQTPSSTIDVYMGHEHIPPHLNHDAEPEDSMHNADPINLTGRIKKLKDGPVAMGGSSDIFYAEWKLYNPRKVAVKVLRTTSVTCLSTVQRRLRREMHLWWKLRHRNIVPLWGYASDFGNLDAMVSPWMRNGSATSYIKMNKSSWSERMKLFGDVIAGLKYLHNFQPPIIHGDLKPTNVLISDEGNACLCDFGLARIINITGAPSGFTTSNFAGSIRYMAPELLDVEEEDEELLPQVNEMSDIYALGCVGLEMITDRIPYANRNLDAQVMHDIIRGILPSSKPATIKLADKESHAKLWEIITSTWQRDPSRRPNIVLVSKLVADCKIRRGPPLLAEGNILPTSRSSRPVSRSASLSQTPGSVKLDTRLIPLSRTRSMSRSLSNPGSPRQFTRQLRPGGSDGITMATTIQRPRSFVIASSPVSSSVPSSTLQPASQSVTPSIPTSTSLPSLAPSYPIQPASEDVALSKPSQRLLLGGIEEEDSDNNCDKDGQRPNAIHNRAHTANKVDKITGLRRLLPLPDSANLLSSKSSANTTNDLVPAMSSSGSAPFSASRSRRSSDLRPARNMSQTFSVTTSQESISQSRSSSSHPRPFLHPPSASPPSTLSDSSGFISLRRSLSANWKHAISRGASLHQRSGSIESFKPSTTAQNQVWHDN